MMVKFRRSLKGDSKHDSAKPVQVSIPQKDAIAIEPPKKVIKALYDHTAPTVPPHYLSFSAGDFLHVLSRENDPDWYEACNPLQGTRGLVPVKFFETVGKTVRDSGDSGKSGSATHDSGYSEGATPSTSSSHTMMPGGSNGVPPLMVGHRTSKSLGKAGGVYGIVAYDFHAERPDELDAKKGEAIIVIAQSNPEWFVAKPITRLGGPGLIPVSFIEIRDMTTGRPVEDPVEAVRQAGIPRVEEWKKMAAEYKNTSIPLGTVSSSQQALQQGMERMSLNSQTQNGHQQRHQSGHDYNSQQQQNLYAPERASVPRYIFADEKFHFIVECRLSNGTHWDLSRIYEDFYELQINLINAFPEEAGQRPGKQRILPYMPGPVKFVTDNISEGRRANLDEYLRDLLRLQPHITCSSLVRNFFAPREGDFEVDPNATDLNEHARPVEARDRSSATSQVSLGQQQSIYHQQQQPAAYQSPPMPSPLHQSTPSQASGSPYGQQQIHYRSPSEFGPQSQTPPGGYAPASRQANAISQTSQTLSTGPSQGGSGTGTVPVKVKAWFDRDTCVVIRMPARGAFGFKDLHRRIVERRRLEYKSQEAQPDEQLEIEYRDEKTGDYYRLEGDEDLEIALERNEKLTLAVRALAS